MCAILLFLLRCKTNKLSHFEWFLHINSAHKYAPTEIEGTQSDRVNALIQFFHIYKTHLFIVIQTIMRAQPITHIQWMRTSADFIDVTRINSAAAVLCNVILIEPIPARSYMQIRNLYVCCCFFAVYFLRKIQFRLCFRRLLRRCDKANRWKKELINPFSMSNEIGKCAAARRWLRRRAFMVHTGNIAPINCSIR